MRGHKFLGLLTTAIALSIFTGCTDIGGGDGTKLDFNGNDVYYTSNVTEDEAKKLGDYLVESKFFGEDGITVQLDKVDDKYQFRMVVKEGYDKKEDTIRAMESHCSEFSYEVFDKKPLEVHLCDNKLKTLKVVQGDANDYRHRGTKLEFNGGTLYYTSNVTEAEAKKLGEVLVKEKFYNGDEKLTQIDKEDGKYQFRLIVGKGREKKQEVIDIMRNFAKGISNDPFNGKPVEVHLCDGYLKTLRVVTADEKPKENKEDPNKKTSSNIKSDQFQLAAFSYRNTSPEFLDFEISDDASLSPASQVAYYANDEEEYGIKLIFNGGELYYTNKVTAAEAKKLGAYLIKEKFFDGTAKTLQLSKENKTYQVRMVVKEGFDKKPSYLKVMKAFCSEISYVVFNKQSTAMHLCDERLKTLKVVQGDAKDYYRSGTLLTFNKGELYYTENVTEAEAKKFGNYLLKEKFFDGVPKTVRLNKYGKYFEFKMVVKKGFEKNQNYLKAVKEFSQQASKAVLDGKPLEVHLCDEYMVTLAVVNQIAKPKPTLGKKLVVNGNELFYTAKVTEAEAKKLGNFLVLSKFFQGKGKSVQLNKTGKTYEFRFVVKKGFDTNEAYHKNVKTFIQLISKHVLAGANVEAHLCDAKFKTLKVVKNDAVPKEKPNVKPDEKKKPSL